MYTNENQTLTLIWRKASKSCFGNDCFKICLNCPFTEKQHHILISRLLIEKLLLIDIIRAGLVYDWRKY